MLYNELSIFFCLLFCLSSRVQVDIKCTAVDIDKRIQAVSLSQNSTFESCDSRDDEAQHWVTGNGGQFASGSRVVEILMNLVNQLDSLISM